MPEKDKLSVRGLVFCDVAIRVSHPLRFNRNNNNNKKKIISTYSYDSGAFLQNRTTVTNIRNSF